VLLLKLLLRLLSALLLLQVLPVKALLL